MALALAHLIDGSLATNGGATGTVTATSGARVLVSLGISVAGGGATHATDSVAIVGGGVTWTQKSRVALWGGRRATYVFESSGTPSSATLAITYTSGGYGTWESTKYSVDEVTGMDTGTPFGTAYTQTADAGMSNTVTVSETPDAGDVVFYACAMETNETMSLNAELDTTLIQFGNATGARRLITAYDSAPDATPTPGTTWTTDSGSGAVAFIVNVASGVVTTTQEGYRWRLDDGSESAATWAVAQDTGITAPANEVRRLRVLIDTSGDVNATLFQLEYKEANDANYTKVS